MKEQDVSHDSLVSGRVSGKTLGGAQFLIIFSDPNISQHHKIQSPHFRDADIEAEREQISCPQTS